MPCTCPQTDVELAERVLADDAEELVICAEAYAKMLVLTFGAGSTAEARPSFEMHRGNPLLTAGPVAKTVVKPGLMHDEAG